jgi:hypothetical protein
MAATAGGSGDGPTAGGDSSGALSASGEGKPKGHSRVAAGTAAAGSERGSSAAPGDAAARASGSAAAAGGNGATSSDTPSSGGTGVSSGGGRLALLSRLTKGQRSKGADDAARSASAPAAAAAAAATPPGAAAAAEGGAAGASRGGAPTPRVAAFAGEVQQDRATGAWALRGFDAELRALSERVPQLQRRLRAAVAAEQEEQERELRRLYASSSLERLRQDGVLLFPLRAAPHGVELGQMLWRLAPGGGGELGHHKFRAGDSVLLRRYAAAPQVGRGPASGGARAGARGVGCAPPVAAALRTHPVARAS